MRGSRSDSRNEDDATPSSSRGRRVRLAVTAAGVALLAAGGLYAAGLVSTGDDISDGTRVDGVDIGGMSREEARATLQSSAPPSWTAPIPVRIGESTGTVDPATAGLSVDVEKTVDKAADPGRDPVTVIGRLFSSDERTVEPVVAFDETKARAAMAETARTHDRARVEGEVAFKNGQAVTVQARDGQKLDVDGSVDTLRANYPEPEGENQVTLPTAVSRPEVSEAETARFLNTFGTPAMSGPVTLTVDGERLRITPTTLGAHLTVKADDQGRLVPTLDSKALIRDPAVARPLDAIATGPVEARLGVENGQVVVLADGRPGHEVTAKALGDAVMPLLPKRGEAARTGPVATELIQPVLTRKSVAEMGIKEQMSTFTVNFPTAPYRTINIGRAVELINGSLVRPGEVWSFNKTVGERTKANGFVDGTMILDGQYHSAPGGGVSAVATTVFNAIFFAGVKPVEYGAHSFYIERYPPGREATVAWGTLDLKFRNNSDASIYIKASATDSSVTISFLGTKKYDEVEAVEGPRTNLTEPAERTGTGPKCEPQPPLEGFDITVDRVFRDGGAEVGRETFRTHYTPRDRVTCESEEPPPPAPEAGG
ncbi:VanW family protein [Streptomyces sp. P9(2023)]|uniref:VanW family protein n=1 Tax=Streptomyces sp. P9(2023) TaxID=3064394 RepID=UPI0028F4301E|nr:VanW family protein [Streptomyces sp. P9(2023)]